MLMHTNISNIHGGKTDRAWKNHKWIARKRNKNGKWIYDYGKGFADKVQDALDEEKSKMAFNDMMNKGKAFIDSIGNLNKEKSKTPFNDTMNKGKAFIDSIGKWLETTEVGKTIHDIGPHNDGNRSKFGKFIDELNPTK